MSDLLTPRSDAAQETPAPRRASKRLLTVIVILLLAPWLVVAMLFVQTKPYRRVTAALSRLEEAATADPDRVFRLAKGPWGDLECVRIALGPPTEFLFSDIPKAATPRWFFKGTSVPLLTAFLNSAELTDAERAALLDSSRWEVTAEGVWLQPPVDVVLGLSPNARRHIYDVLRNYWENEAQHAPLIFKPGLVDERFAGSDVSAATVERFKRLLYSQDNWLLLADLYVLLHQITDPAEKRELHRVALRQWTYLVKLHITPQSDIDQLEDYWGAGRRKKDLGPLLESLQHVEGGADINIVHLLPSFPRKLLYTFPYPTDNPVEQRRDCHWTSFNFFNEEPDDTFADLAKVAQVTTSDYDQVATPKMGDVVVLMSPQGDVVHSCVYIADDLVFNKKGAHFLEPWILIKLKDAVDLYRLIYRSDYPLAIKFLRRKPAAGG